MIFTQLEFLIFLAVVLAASWRCRTRVTRNSLLLLASYYFYAYWDWRFCGLLLASTLIDFFVARWMLRCDATLRRRMLLAISLGVNLGMLGFFKYFDFFIDTARPLVESLGMNAGSLNIILPVGISFFTFQTLSYTIDVYRRRLVPTESLLDFALYVAFFPQLVAGPIVRAVHLLPQLSSVPIFRSRRMYAGFQQLLRGAVKKVLLADRLGETVDIVFAGPELYSSPTVWIAVIAYAGQIYYDFSGYSDMAIGVAKMLGYRFPGNFRHPYLATSMSDFWRRWHITLSTWLRDYLYIPLGGSRGTQTQTFRNLLITMSLGGLWHGAAMTFLLWGIWHGLMLIASQILTVQQATRSSLGRRGRLVAWATTFTVVLIGWVLFRCTSVQHSLIVYHRMFIPTWQGIIWLPPLTLLVLSLAVIEHAVWTTRMRRWMRLPVNAWYSPIATTVMIWCLLLYAPRGFRPFVYFQF